MRTSSTVLDSSTGFVSSFEVDSGDITPSTAARILERIPGVSAVRVRRLFTRTEGIRVWFHYRDRECAVWEPFGDNDCYTVLPIEGVEPIDLAEIERAFREHPPLWNRRLAHLAARRTPTMLLYTTAWISAVAGTLLAPGLDFP
ncbi:MAG TPA: hypothetical protein VLA66_14465, partial [Thermoanaerobaculia bacterium]|nr:hypothetical protein [Thermoanaerobaculia bacterium]